MLDRRSFRRNRLATRFLFTGLTAAVALLAVPALASAATRLVNPAGNDVGDCTGTPCLHIQYAVNQAAANDTISVAAGTYDTEPNNQVVVDKGLTITGAGIGNTILDGNNGSNLAAPGTLRINTTTSDSVSVSGLTVREAGSQGAVNGNTNPRRLIYTKTTVNALTAPTYTIDSVRFEGSGNGAADYGLYSQGDTSSLVISNSVFVNSDFNPIVLERHQGPSNIHDNTISKATATNASMYSNFNYETALPGTVNGAAGATSFHDNTVDASGYSGASFTAGLTGGTVGGYASISVADNSFTNIGAGTLAVAISNSGANPGTATVVGDTDVTGNAMIGPGTIGVRLNGLLSGVDVSNNQILNFTRGIQINEASGTPTHGAATATMHFNRLVNNSTAQLDNTFGAVVNAENNWWGCNAGPNNPGCGTVIGGTVDFDPWLVFSLSAAPTSIEIGGQTATISADLRHNSNGSLVGTAHPDGLAVPFSTNLGSVTSPGNLVSGVATSTLTSGGTSGTATVSSTVDGQVATTPVTITDTGIPDTQIDSGPANNSTTAVNTPQFTFSSPNDPLATFQCRVDSSDPADFVACTTPHTTAALADGPHTFEVRAVDVNLNPDPSPARRAFIVDTTPDSGGVAGAVGGSDSGACGNRIAGDAKPNNLKGTKDGDRMLGYDAADRLSGKSGYDCLKGGRGDDTLNGGLSSDVLQGGPGDDTINARDGKRDKVNCGAGGDVAVVDQYDVVRNCEAAPLRSVFLSH